METKRVAITGSSGLVGSRIVELLKDDFYFIKLSSKEFDITNQKQVNSILSKLDFDIFLHSAAYTKVDEAEREKKLVYKINVDGTRNVFNAVQQLNKKFIYISTDFVFDGRNPPYFEDSLANPISEYGRSKYEGEKIVAGRGMIVRISYPYRIGFEQKKDFVRTIFERLQQKQILNAVNDSLITPTFVDDIAYGLKYLLQNYTPEIFHLVGADSLSPYAACNLVAQTFTLDKKLIKPITYQKYFQGKAKRPQYSEIKSKKNNFYKMTNFATGLNLIMNNYR